MKILGKARRGSGLIEWIIAVPLIIVILFVPVGHFFLDLQMQMYESSINEGLQVVSTGGGLTDTAERVIFKNLENRGVIPTGSYESGEAKEHIELVCTADARGGNTSAIVPRGSEITLSIKYPITKQIHFLAAVTFGAGGMYSDEGEWYVWKKGTVLSEKVN